jgi:ribosomal protein L40E
MKIFHHPRITNITIGDEVYCHANQLSAHVHEVFPAAVCVRVGILERRRSLELITAPQLWPADDIENLSVCRHCGSREDLAVEHGSGIPFRICLQCAGRPAPNGQHPFHTHSSHDDR